MNQEQLAWAAGLFEGEGCLSIQKMGNRRVASAAIVHTDIDVLDRFHCIIGMGRISERKTRPRVKPQWTWRISKHMEVVTLIGLLRPWLGVRRTVRALEILDIPFPRPRSPEACKHGHPFDDTNTRIYHRPGGGIHRECRTCHAEWQRLRRARLRAVA